MKSNLYILFISFFLTAACTDKAAETEKHPAEAGEHAAENEGEHHESETRVELTPEQYIIGKIALGRISQ